MSVEAKGVIHDIGYQRYNGPRLGRGYAIRSLYVQGFRVTYGLGRTAKAMIFPWTVAGLVVITAVVLAAIRAQLGSMPASYWDFPRYVSFLVILFCAVVAPELVSRDLRGGVLPLYFSRPLTRTDYALAKLSAMLSGAFLLLAVPQLIMFIGGVFTVEGRSAVFHEILNFARGLSVSAVYAVVFATLSLLVASLAGRRAVAAAMIVALFLITTPVLGVMRGLAESRSDGGPLTGADLHLYQAAGLVSPMTLVDGVAQWWYGDKTQVGTYGPVFGLVVLGLFVVSALLLLVRYRKVAR